MLQNRFTPLLHIAKNLETKILRCTLPANKKGFYHIETNTIFLNTKLTNVELICALAHELGHAYFGHSTSTETTEAQANAYACELIINQDEYAKLEKINPCPFYIAEELEVTPELLYHYQTHILALRPNNIPKFA